MRLRPALLLAAVLMTGGVPTACHRGQVRMVQGINIKEEKRGLWQRATLSADAAMRIAAARVPGGRVTGGELEEEDGRLIYSFDVKVEGRPGVEEVWVDARTGEVVSVKHEGDE